MSSKEFNQLTVDQKARVILRESIFLTAIHEYSYKVHLYALGNFFVEVRLTPITSDVMKIGVIQGKELDKFIHHIELPSWQLE